jgi:hypothetical protein
MHDLLGHLQQNSPLPTDWTVGNKIDFPKFEILTAVPED